jgi:hypothetical protein
LRLVHAHREPIPAITDYELLMIGGTPDAAYRLAKFPYLTVVHDVICRAVRADEACFEICYRDLQRARKISGNGGRVFLFTSSCKNARR